MTSIIIAVDDPRRPKKSQVLAGPEVPVDEQRKLFAEIRQSRTNSSGLPWVQMWNIESPQIASTPTKSKGTK